MIERGIMKDNIFIWERSLLFNKTRTRAFVAEKFEDDKYFRGEGYSKDEALSDLKEIGLDEQNLNHFSNLEKVRFFYEL